MNKDNTKVTFAGGAITLVGNPVKIGDKAENFTAINQGLAPVSLSDFDGKVKILSIFPSVDTGVCSAQAHRFNKEASNLGDNVQIITLSNDLPFALGRFCGAEGIENLITLSDHKEMDFGYKFGFAIEELRLLTRGVVVIDKENIVQYVEYVPEVTDAPNFDAALEAAKALV
ncbi:thiol peroxidase [Ancylomarina euxinus]|uniref:Thiol peroxidase n=1 Tax=Ancylomarina euxinus TaxID=2283627 RepID=A0A425Y3Z6_9BACT|nr:thiol peroxidase [Ancylomarina euxinus]MCZ4694523.1 thiol peroxidase [Ancylomarina euxinus]MUP14066.1 thiol peroxidase [Ancylomarina euxinus]RRG22927.1 thiol peroxidase [Ancylomarina euxinus]